MLTCACMYPTGHMCSGQAIEVTKFESNLGLAQWQQRKVIVNNRNERETTVLRFLTKE